MSPDEMLRQNLARLEGLESAERRRRKRALRPFNFAQGGRAALFALAGKLCLALYRALWGSGTGPAVAVLGLATWVLAQGLEVKTTDTATDIQRMKIETSSGVGVAANAYFMNANLGIGTTAPARRLHVVETSNPAILAERNQADPNSVWIPLTLKLTYAGGQMTDGFGPGLRFEGRDADAVDNYLGSVAGRRDGADNNGALAFFTTVAGTGAERMRVSSAGNVGIGTTDPLSRLDIADTQAAGTALIRVGDDSFLTDVDTANTLGIYGIQDSTIASLRLGSGGGTLAANSSGNLGIPSASASSLLNVTTSGGTDQVPLILERDSATTASSATVAVLRRLTTGAAASGIGGRLTYQLETSTGAISDASYLIGKFTTVTNASEDAEVSVMNMRDGTMEEQVRILGDASTVASAGSVNIINSNTADGFSSHPLRLATGTPTAGTVTRLIRFYGNATTTTNGTGIGRIRSNGVPGIVLESGGADYAEYYAALDQGLVPGEIVCLDAGGVRRATAGDGRCPVGIVSDRAIVIGNAPNDDLPNYEEGKVVVGMLGQLPARVSTVNGPLRVGDPITASPVPGVAMKATTPGVILGWAIEPCENGDPGTVRKVNVLLRPGWFDPGVASQAAEMSALRARVAEQAAEIAAMKAKAAAAESLLESRLEALERTLKARGPEPSRPALPGGGE